MYINTYICVYIHVYMYPNFSSPLQASDKAGKCKVLSILSLDKLKYKSSSLKPEICMTSNKFPRAYHCSC